MLRIVFPALLLAILPTRPDPAAPQDSPAPQPQPVIEVQGQAFATWQEYLQSDLFRTLGLRCGSRLDASVSELRPASDCSLGSTTILPQYDPAGHTQYQIPVVFHIIQHTGGQGNVSDAMIQSQIDVLNEDFLALAGTLGENGNDARISFYLANEDPDGNPTTGITRTTDNDWFLDAGDYWTTLAWDPSRYLNIYSNNASGALGYVPDLPQGGIVGADYDRIVLLWSTVGRNAPIGPPFHLGRTATHEAGHYFGLYHTFDGGCSSPSGCYTNGDRICDTNPEGNPVFGCPGSSNQCSSPGGDPYHNYMDYSDDDCYEEFTPEQVNRMRCTLENWRIDLPAPEFPCGATASAVTRNGGANPSVYQATPPVLGGVVTMDVTDAVHNVAIVVGHALPGNQTLAGGQVLLYDNSSPRYFRYTMSLPVGHLNLPVPNDVAYCGLTVTTQVILFGGAPFVLTNAVDMTAGI